MLLQNLVNGSWVTPSTDRSFAVQDPATGEAIADVPLSNREDVEQVVTHASKAFSDWRATPVTERIQVLFRFKSLLEEHLDELARTATRECGKTLAEAQGELRRGIENVEVACGMPLLMQGYNNEDIARGIDEHLYRQPLGVVAAITPFNFPGMIPLWFLPYAIGCGNCFVLKPSEKTPMTAAKLLELLLQAGVPAGVASLVHGDGGAVSALIEHPDVRAISFVGSTPVAKSVYARAASHGKRVQCQGGAKNPLIILPDADMQMTKHIAADSAFGCAGQRCLAASLAITVAGATRPFVELIQEAAESRTVGNGLEQGVEMGPVITTQSRARICNLVQEGVEQGAELVVDGRQPNLDKSDGGNFLRPMVVRNVDPENVLAKQELFGPVLSVLEARDLDEAIAMVNSGSYGNMACLFTSSGASARRFRRDAHAGNIGINLGVAAPMAFFSVQWLAGELFW